MIKFDFNGKITHRRVDNLSKKILNAIKDEKKLILVLDDLSGDLNIIFNLLISLQKTAKEFVKEVDLVIKDKNLKSFLKRNDLEKYLNG
ncbi:MAG: hypothetical protein C0601_12585 [Candidatus Muiribacterium halophilum]|uniref:STAS domain-containing protein n=1 Tax=Muiribacterium halophilum TaxID=2053465 RepID=A0A2N5ZA77_MUIH1|nr:MAG: hypothetical protein C0601_12585 [Candidatus Muirbacterium halophilum]